MPTDEELRRLWAQWNAQVNPTMPRAYNPSDANFRSFLRGASPPTAGLDFSPMESTVPTIEEQFVSMLANVTNEDLAKIAEGFGMNKPGTTRADIARVMASRPEMYDNYMTAYGRYADKAPLPGSWDYTDSPWGINKKPTTNLSYPRGMRSGFTGNPLDPNYGTRPVQGGGGTPLSSLTTIIRGGGHAMEDVKGGAESVREDVSRISPKPVVGFGKPIQGKTTSALASINKKRWR